MNWRYVKYLLETICLLKIYADYSLSKTNLLSQLLLCGTGEYSVADLRAHHIANGSSPEFLRVLDWFWTAVSNFTQEEMARLLQFTTGCSQLPPGGFQQLSPRFQITAAPTFANLPTAHTWYVLF